MIEITLADYSNPAHAQAVIAMLDAYAKDPMGGSEGISDEVKENLIKEMDKREHVFSLLAFDGDQPVGVVTVLKGFQLLRLNLDEYPRYCRNSGVSR